MRSEVGAGPALLEEGDIGVGGGDRDAVAR